MGLLTLSGSLVTKSAVGKAVRTWAAQRAFGGGKDGGFAASMGTVGSSGQIRLSHHQECTHMGVVGDGA
jgi:hypothetical protein